MDDAGGNFVERCLGGLGRKDRQSKRRRIRLMMVGPGFSQPGCLKQGYRQGVVQIRRLECDLKSGSFS
jgi:hypothetical protein